ncbi:YciI family protein [Rothia uropygialis]|uniref:YciI family protein n=1 Tax=Kocuria sp. 36 TaxID=1415402 RepID=UPI00101D2D19|nr:YciI family protein [Kocuria sp. 36]
MGLFAVCYRYAEGSEAGRAEHREEHLAFLQEQFDAGRLVVSGPTDVDGGDKGALLIIRADSAVAVEEVMDQEPFEQRGYVARTIRTWTPKFGADRLASSKDAS